MNLQELIGFSNFGSVVRNCHPRVDLELLIEIGSVVEAGLLCNFCNGKIRLFRHYLLSMFYALLHPPCTEIFPDHLFKI